LAFWLKIKVFYWILSCLTRHHKLDRFFLRTKKYNQKNNLYSNKWCSKFWFCQNFPDLSEFLILTEILHFFLSKLKTKNFKKNFGSSLKFVFCPKCLLLPKINYHSRYSRFVLIFNLNRNFTFFLIFFQENVGFRVNFWFFSAKVLLLPKFNYSSPNFQFLPKFGFLAQIFDFRPKFQFWWKINFSKKMFYSKMAGKCLLNPPEPNPSQ